MEPLRIGVLGAARIAELAIIEPARITGDRLVAVAARDRQRAEAFAARYGVERVLDSYADLVTDPEVDVVYNPLANGLHARWNLAAIAAGKPVLTEKPFSSNAEEAREVRDAAGKSGVTIVEGFHYLHHPMTRRVLEVLESGELGELRFVEADIVIPPPPPEDPRWSLQLAGGALMDLGCYCLHVQRTLAKWAGGPPRLVAARGGERVGLPGVDEWMAAYLRFPSGATGVARCNMAGEELRMTYRVVCDLGSVTVPNFVQPRLDDRLLITTSSASRIEQFGERSTYTYQLEAFRRHVREGAPYPIDADDAVGNLVLIDDCYGAASFTPRPAAKPERGTAGATA